MVELISKFKKWKLMSRNSMHPHSKNLQAVFMAAMLKCLNKGQSKQTMSRLESINQKTSCGN